MGIEIKFPILFLLAIPAGITIYLFLKKNQGKKANLIAGLRTGVYILLITALTVPLILWPVRGETVIFLVDRSKSVDNSKEISLDWIEKSLESKDKDDEFAIVSFGENALVEQQLGSEETLISDYQTTVRANETSIEEGLHLASSLIPDNSNGRIVLFSDGNETSGQSVEAAALLKNRNISIDYVTLTSDEREDMSLSELHVPSSMYEGEEAKINVQIDSNSEKQVTLRISVNNREILKEDLAVKKGTNLYTFTHKTEDTGLLIYKGEISAENDAYSENNVFYSVSNIKGIPKILLVQEGEHDQVGSILSDAGFMVDVISPEKLPTVLSGYLSYQSIIFNNVPATAVSQDQMNLIQKAVKEFGTGFVMAGGENSFGLGGYFKTPIESLLPVDMDIKGKKQMPSLGLVIVMDRSGSMSGSKLDLAKEAAARSVELLREEDTLGFIAFDDRPWVIVETEPLKDKEKAVEKILSVTPGGGTEIYSSLALAYEQLEGLKLQRKHIILLTDGQSARDGNYHALLEEGKENNITLSTVALGRDADRALLENLATTGAGRFYDVTDTSSIPSILSRETVMATRTYIEDEPFYPNVLSFSQWSGLFDEGVPQMNAYIATTPKPKAEVQVISEKEDPVYAEWQYGMGRTAAFTTDFSGKWSGDWTKWGNWPSFITKMVSKTLPQYDTVPYHLSMEKRAGETVIHLEAAGNKALPIETGLVSESGEKVDMKTKLVAPGKYELTLPDGGGVYFLNVKQRDQNGAVQVYQTGFTVPYSEEFLLKEPNKDLLHELAEFTGGKELSAARDPFRTNPQQAYEKQPVSQWLILLAFLLFFVEIAVRRFGIKLFRKKAVQGVRSIADSDSSKRIERLRESSKHKAEINRRTVHVNKEKIDKVEEEEKPLPKAKKATKGSGKRATMEDRENQMQRLLLAKKRKDK